MKLYGLSLARNEGSLLGDVFQLFLYLKQQQFHAQI